MSVITIESRLVEVVLSVTSICRTNNTTQEQRISEIFQYLERDLETVPLPGMIFDCGVRIAIIITGHVPFA